MERSLRKRSSLQIEDALYAKFKIWKEKKDTDNKVRSNLNVFHMRDILIVQYRQRQFDNCKEIEGLYLKMDEIPKTTKNSVKEVSKVNIALRQNIACVFPRELFLRKIYSIANIPFQSSAILTPKQTSNVRHVIYSSLLLIDFLINFRSDYFSFILHHRLVFFIILHRLKWACEKRNKNWRRPRRNITKRRRKWNQLDRHVMLKCVE